MKKNYTTAPLPFQGQKRRFINAFGLAIQELKQQKDIKVIVDLFGGSGLLSHTAKRIFPECKVIYNDFDDYCQRLRHIDKTNQLLSDIREIMKDEPSGKRVSIDCANKVKARVAIEDQQGYVDYITLSSSLMFSTQNIISLEGLNKNAIYNRVISSNYVIDIESYLFGLDVVKYDYKELYDLYKDVEGVLFLVDPPYLSTDTSTYKSDKYWRLRDYLDVLKVLQSNYFFFTSNKSCLVELCEWIEENKLLGNPFKDSVLSTQNVTLNKTSSYTDMMLYRFDK